MKRTYGSLWLIAVLLAPLVSPASSAEAAGAAATVAPLEQQSFDDLAARLAEHLRATADLLVKIRGTADPEERRQELESYAVAMQTTDRLSQAMRVLAGPSGKDVSKGCAMMAEAPGKPAVAAKGVPETGADTSAGEGHEGHH